MRLLGLVPRIGKVEIPQEAFIAALKMDEIRPRIVRAA